MASGRITAAAIVEQLKEVYQQDEVRDATYESNPLYAMLPKKRDKSGGKYFVNTVQYSYPTGARSRNSAVTLARTGRNAYADFQIPWKTDYNKINIDRDTLKLAAGNPGSFFEEKPREIDGFLKALTLNAGHSLFRGTGGARGQISAAGFTGATFTLTNPSDTRFFEQGDVLVFSTANGNTASDTLIPSTASPVTATVTIVDRDTGAITLDAAPAGVGASAFVFKEGDFQNSISGLEAWIPTTAPGVSDSFLGFNRSVDPVRLAGMRVTGTGMRISEAIALGQERGRREDAMFDLCIMDTQTRRQLAFELDNKVQYNMVKPEDGVTVGFKAIEFVSQNSRPLMILEDPNCQPDRIWLLTKETWEIIHVGELPDMWDEDGTMHVEAANWGFEIRADMMYNLRCKAPKDNLVITL